MLIGQRRRVSVKDVLNRSRTVFNKVISELPPPSVIALDPCSLQHCTQFIKPCLPVLTSELQLRRETLYFQIMSIEPVLTCSRCIIQKHSMPWWINDDEKYHYSTWSIFKTNAVTRSVCIITNIITILIIFVCCRIVEINRWYRVMGTT